MSNPNISTPAQERSKNSREKILLAALELFVLQGYSKTSTREIADRAEVNLSSIKYYFGDKEGLYKAVYNEPVMTSKRDIDDIGVSDSVEQVLTAIFSDFIRPLKESAHIKMCIKLRMREMIEPTGLRNADVDCEIMPYYAALFNVIKREINQMADEDIHRLVFSIMSMGVFLYMGQDIILGIKPDLISSNESLDVWHQKMVLYALSMISAEKKSYHEN